VLLFFNLLLPSNYFNELDDFYPSSLLRW